MAETIVMSCLPVEGAPLTTTPEGGTVVLRVRRFAGDAPAAEPLPEGVTPLSRFAVEGVIVGDARTWDEVRFDHVADGADAEALLDLTRAEEGFAIVVAPTAPFDRLVESVHTADEAPKREA